MKLGKPPVVEVRISVDFDPNDNKRQWDLGLVQQYARLCEAEFPRREAPHESFSPAGFDTPRCTISISSRFLDHATAI